MNLNYLIRLSCWGVVGAAYFCLTTVVQAQTLSVTGGQKDEGIRRRGLASDLIIAQGVTRVTGVTVDRTESGLELILETATGSERLVPLILPQGNDLVIDILDATLAFSIRNGVNELNPAPEISKVTVSKADENSIQVRITGENQAPSAEVVPGRNDLVLSIAPEGATTEQEPDEEIEVIATGQAEDDDYNFTDASVGTRTDTPTRDVPQSIQVIPQEVIEDQQVTNTTDALRNIPGILPADSNRTLFNNVTIRGFGGGSMGFDFGTDVYRRNGLRDPQGASNTGDTANIERIEVLKGPSSVLYGQGSPGGIINLVTKQPLSEPFYEVSGEIGNYNFYRGTVDLTGPLDENKKLLYRLNVAAETSESFIDFYDRDRYLINPVLAWNISDDTKLSLEFEYRSVRSLNDAGLPAVGTVIELSRNEVRSNNTFFVPAGAGSIDIFDPQYGIATLTEPTRFTDRKTTDDGLGIYLQDQVTLSDKFTVVLGGRFDILTNEAEDFNLDTNEFQQNEGFSPRLGLVYKPIENISLYASYSRSLEQSIGESADGGVFDPGRGTQYELGVKGDIGDRLSATLALYDLTRTNVLTDDPDNPNPQFNIQTGEQNSQGIELSVAGEILRGWNIIGGYAYTDATITEDNVFEEGNRLDNVPENAVSLWTTYTIQQGSVKGLGFGARIFFVGEREGDLDNSFQLPSYTRTDAAIFYERDKFRTAVNFRNLFDINYFEAADNDLEVYPGDPFTVVGSVSYKF